MKDASVRVHFPMFKKLNKILVPSSVMLAVCSALLILYSLRGEAEHVQTDEFPYSMDGVRYSSPSLDSCVHLALVVDNMTSTTTFIKSVLIHRHSLLHFHFLVSDDVLENILHTLMMSWDLQDLVYSVYSIHKQKSNESWIPSASFYDNDAMNNIVKLHLPSILPATLHKVLVLADNQLIMTNDVWDVWQLFLDKNIKNKPIAVSGNNHDDFDGGIIIYNLELLRRIQWKEMWHKFAMKLTLNSPLHSLITTRMILNCIIDEFPNITSFLPCNLIENCMTSSERCTDGYYNDVTKPSFISLKAKNCSRINDLYSRYYELQSFVNTYNSISLRREYDRRVSYRKVLPVFMCHKLKEASNSSFVTRLFFVGGYYKPENEFETTLVTQLSINRLEMFVKLMDHWTGPASITMYGNDVEVWNTMQFLKQYCEFKERQNIAIHFVIKQGIFYPVNYLRNVALSNVKTEFVFLNDADFLPSFEMHERLKVYNRHLLNNKMKRALVIPAFQSKIADLTYPSDKAALLKFLQFSSKVTTFCPNCYHKTHGPTRYKQWYDSLYPYEINWAYHYEPYVVVKSDVVKYNQNFMGYGWNKVSQITELKAQQYQFIVVPDNFIIHIPHKQSNGRGIWSTGSFKYCINKVWKDFINDLKHKYGANCLQNHQQATIVFDNK